MRATPQENAALLPGDDLVDANLVTDRATTLSGTAEDLWPWLVQLGKRRAGWYFPSKIERLLPPGGRGLRHLEPAYAGLAIGDRVPDWGPGEPEFEVALLDRPHSLVYRSLRQRSRGHRWPVVDPPPADTLDLSWALVSRDVGEGVRLHLRLRVRTTRTWTVPVARVAGGAMDALTVGLLFAGLRERLRPTAHRSRE
jgi:hypothetical protein